MQTTCIGPAQAVLAWESFANLWGFLNKAAVLIFVSPLPPVSASSNIFSNWTPYRTPMGPIVLDNQDCTVFNLCSPYIGSLSYKVRLMAVRLTDIHIGTCMLAQPISGGFMQVQYC